MRCKYVLCLFFMKNIIKKILHLILKHKIKIYKLIQYRIYLRHLGCEIKHATYNEVIDGTGSLTNFSVIHRYITCE